MCPRSPAGSWVLWTLGPEPIFNHMTVLPWPLGSQERERPSQGLIQSAGQPLGDPRLCYWGTRGRPFQPGAGAWVTRSMSRPCVPTQSTEHKGVIMTQDCEAHRLYVTLRGGVSWGLRMPRASLPT